MVTKTGWAAVGRYGCCAGTKKRKKPLFLWRWWRTRGRDAISEKESRGEGQWMEGARPFLQEGKLIWVSRRGSGFKPTRVMGIQKKDKKIFLSHFIFISFHSSHVDFCTAERDLCPPACSYWWPLIKYCGAKLMLVEILKKRPENALSQASLIAFQDYKKQLITEQTNNPHFQNSFDIVQLCRQCHMTAINQN